MVTTKEGIGWRIRKLRKEAGYKNQEALAKKVIIRKGKPTTADQIGRIERGVTNYGIDVLFQIAEILNVDVIDLIGDEKKNESKVFIFEGRIEDVLDRLKSKKD